jgi:type VI secretion system Hcp family effector
MKYQRLFTQCALLLALATGPVLASEEFCISFDGIQGSGGGVNCSFSNSSTAYEYHHLMARPMDSGIPQALQHHQIIVTKKLDGADPQLWQRLDTGALIPEVIIQFPSGGGGGGSGSRFPYLIRLTNARVLGVEPLVPHSADPDNINYSDQSRIRLDYQTISIEMGGGDPVVLTP